MNDSLYQSAIKDLAHAAHGAGRLPQATASAEVDSPLCGDRITLDLQINDDQMAAIGHETRGCLLCRAAMSLLAETAPGHTGAQLHDIREQLANWLAGTRDTAPDWPALAAFAPVRNHKSRHGCVLLPFAAVQAALANLRGKIAHIDTTSPAD